MKPTNGMDRGQFHDKAWALYQAKALDDAKLPKLSIYAIRTLWDVLFDSMPAESKVAQPVEQTRALTGEQLEAIKYARLVMGSVSWETPDSKRVKLVLDTLLTAARPASGETE